MALADPACHVLRWIPRLQRVRPDPARPAPVGRQAYLRFRAVLEAQRDRLGRRDLLVRRGIGRRWCHAEDRWAEVGLGVRRGLSVPVRRELKKRAHKFCMTFLILASVIIIGKGGSLRDFRFLPPGIPAGPAGPGGPGLQLGTVGVHWHHAGYPAFSLRFCRKILLKGFSRGFEGGATPI